MYFSAGNTEKKSFADNLLKAYFDSLLELCFLDSTTSTDLMKVGTLLKPFQSLFSPRIILKVFYYHLRKWLSKTLKWNLNSEIKKNEIDEMKCSSPIYRL